MHVSTVAPNGDTWVKIKDSILKDDSQDRQTGPSHLEDLCNIILLLLGLIHY